MILAFQQVFPKASIEIFSSKRILFSDSWEYKKDRDLLIAIGKAVAHDGKPEPKMMKKEKK